MRDRLKSAECSKFLKALADPERLKIVQCLQSGPKPVGDISKSLNSPLANVSHHLGLLRSAGLVLSRRKGRFIFYELAPAVAGNGADNPLNVLEFGCCRVVLGEK
ncbi:MAG: transcriptional regulator, ArsR family [Phycisphaerales bacterium]|jgi:DNA-binding transcriptional ArsR family regulator|nr:transcriptional regulator, ArsR family [Phycisphaerales bacterium]HWE95010.1 metalloregulator ArsR/SmtB family transcription factor [Tepidisphaeraceae bacterium]